jgi:hypothetical protein
MKKILDIVAISIASIAHLTTGVFLASIGRAFTRMFSEVDMELPLISKVSVGYTAMVSPILVGIALCLATLVGLVLVSRSEKIRWLLPFLLTISFVVVILHLMFVSFGVMLPLMHMVSMMNQ